MPTCVIKDSQYRTKLKKSGIDEHLFHAFYGSYINAHEGVPNHETPNLDEIPNANSSEHLAETLHVNKYNSASVSDILATTLSESIEEANIKLNDDYSDLEVDLLPLNEEVIVQVERRPSNYEFREKEEKFISDGNINTGVLFNSLFTKLRKLYGIDLIPITDKELSTNQWKDVPDVLSSSAFIYNGNIYINTDHADIDAPIHEMTHILLGSIRFKNPELYIELIKLADQFNSFNQIASNYPNRTLQDIYEEVFVQETARYLAGLDSAINKLDNKIQYELHYNIKRLLDSALMGEYSVKAMQNEELYNMSLRLLASELNSSLLVQTPATRLDDAKLSRMLANQKSDLIKKGDLREEC